MHNKIKLFYQSFSSFTYPGPYENYLVHELPDDIQLIGHYVRRQIIHRVELGYLMELQSRDSKTPEIEKIPWSRQPEDANFTNSLSIIGELFRRDQLGFRNDRSNRDKLILTCRSISLIMATILKSKGIPTRVRAGFASYLPGYKNVVIDHWVNEYWDALFSRWVLIDVDGCNVITGFDPYDIPKSKFLFAAEAWLQARQNEKPTSMFSNAGGYKGLVVIAWQLIYDFHCVMNNEINYFHVPKFTFANKFNNSGKRYLANMDHLAQLMLDVNTNFEELQAVWETDPLFRILDGPLL